MPKIAIADIKVGKGHRPLIKSHVDELAESIGEIGQVLEPIGVRSDARGGYVLVYGLHRLRGAEQAKLTKIDAIVLDLDDLRMELAEIDENICRHDLSKAQRSIAIARRKAIFLALNPDAEEKAAPAAKARGKHAGGRPKKGSSGNSATVAKFTASTAAATGSSERTVQRESRIGEGLDEEAAEMLADHPVAQSTTQLEQLASLTPAKQREVAARLEDDEEMTVAEALAVEVETDASGNEIPEEVRPLWAYLTEEAPAVSKAIRAAARKLEAFDAALAEHGRRMKGRKAVSRVLAADVTNSIRAFDDLAGKVERARPHAMCATCKGTGGGKVGCGRCYGTGWMGKSDTTHAAKDATRAEKALAR